VKGRGALPTIPRRRPGAGWVARGRASLITAAGPRLIVRSPPIRELPPRLASGRASLVTAAPPRADRAVIADPRVARTPGLEN
jgi:hypothetical protein